MEKGRLTLLARANSREAVSKKYRLFAMLVNSHELVQFLL